MKKIKQKKDIYRLPNVRERKRRSIDRRSVSSDLGAISSLTFNRFNIDRINFFFQGMIKFTGDSNL